MTLLTIVQDAANEVGIPAPSSVIGNLDTNTIRFLALANRGGKAIAQRHPWQALIREWTLTTTATESQGQVESIMPGFNFDAYGTIWNRTTRFPVQGPLYPTEWQFLKAMAITGPWPQFRIRGSELICIPVPNEFDSYAGEYISRFWCQSSLGIGQDRWAADTDTGIFSEDWLTLDLIWRWKKAMGLDYAEEKMEFEMQINNAMARDGSNRKLSLGGRETNDWPHGINVPVGNWPLS